MSVIFRGKKSMLGQSVPAESDSTQSIADRVSVDEQKIQ